MSATLHLALLFGSWLRSPPPARQQPMVQLDVRLAGEATPLPEPTGTAIQPREQPAPQPKRSRPSPRDRQTAPPGPVPTESAAVASPAVAALPAAATGFTATPEPAASPTPAIPLPIRRTAAVVDADACAKPRYPRASLRDEESGTVTLAFLIGTDGLVQDSRVERSSGHPRLDEAARQALALCRFRPATADGRPEASWARLKYVWRIE